MFYIRTYRAIDEPQICEEYIKEHVQVLRDYGIENITSNNNTWVKNPNVYCFIATDVHNELLGGIRIQIADGINLLPVERAIEKLDNRIFTLVKKYANDGGIGELCGLWNSKKVKGMGLSIILVRAAISTVNQLKLQTLTGICAGYSLEMFQKVGFVVDQSFGVNGAFKYPNENYVANVVGLLNGTKLDTATDYDKERMLTLRESLLQERIEHGTQGGFKIDYNLKIDRITEIVFPKSYIL